MIVNEYELFLLKVPIIVPIIVCIVAAYLVVAPIIMNPQMEYVYATIFILSGILFYVPFVHFKCRPAFAGKFNLGFYRSGIVLCSNQW